MFRDSHGNAAGFVIEAFNDAARRENIAVNWVYLQPGETRSALSSGRIDVWPAASSTRERRKEFHVSVPWWSGQTVILSRTLHSRSDLPGKRVGHLRSTSELMRKFLPNVLPVEGRSALELTNQVCAGELDGVLIDGLVLDQLLLHRPAVCIGIPLDIVVGVGVPSELAVLSAKHQANIADTFARRLLEAEADGTLAAIALSYPRIAAASAPFLAQMVDQYHRLRTLRLFVIGSMVLLCAAVFAIIRLRADVKRRRLAEEELRRRNSDLEHFAYASHHDLREPLRNMAIFSQLLQRSGTNAPDAAHHLDQIIRGAHRMSGMLDSVRRFADAALDRHIDAERFSADVALEEAKANLLTQIEESGASVLAMRLPEVCFGKVLLVEMFQNLISNSIKYRSEALPVISVECRAASQEFIFSVRDNGIGIDPRYHEQVFGVFKRLHSRDVPGSGVGLAICRKIVENKGGKMWVDSAPGKGSTFYFTIARVSRYQTRTASSPS